MKNKVLWPFLMLVLVFLSANRLNAQSTPAKKAATVSKAKVETKPGTPPYTSFIKRVSARDVRAIMDTSTTPLIVNFWASWCGPCIREIPWFDSIIAAKKVPVHLLLVNLDFPDAYPLKLEKFLQKHTYKGEVVYLAETNGNYFIPVIAPKWSGAIPASVFVNNAAKYYEVFNYQLTEKRFEMELEKLLN